MSVPDPRRDDACRYARSVAHRFRTLDELAAAVNEAKGLTWTRKALQCAYRRFQVVEPGPGLGSILGRGPASDFDDDPTWPGTVAPAAWAKPIPAAVQIIHDATDRARVSIDTDLAAGPVEGSPLPISPPEPEVQLPAGQRASQLPPDHIVRVEPPTSGYVLVTSDHHYPIHDKAAESAVLALARDINPKVWIANGDVLDAWWISRHDKEAERLVDADSGKRIVDEVDAFRPFMAEMGRIVERGYIGCGNHENRLSALINANPGLHGLPGLRWKAIFDPPANTQVVDYGYRLTMGPLSFVHGDRLGGRFGVKHPTAWALDNHGARSVVFGHTHRMATTFRTTWEDNGPRQVIAINQGHLSDVSKQHYVVEPNWQQGVVVLDFWTEAGRPRYTPHLVPIINGTLRFAGRTYR